MGAFEDDMEAENKSIVEQHAAGYWDRKKDDEIEQLRAENAELQRTIEIYKGDREANREMLSGQVRTAFEQAERIAALIAERDALRALLKEARGHVRDDTSWSYDEPVGWLGDRIDAAIEGRT